MTSLLALSYTGNIKREISATKHMGFCAILGDLLTGKYRLYNVTVVGDGSGVGLHTKIIICVLPNDTSNSSDCVLLSDWFMSG